MVERKTPELIDLARQLLIDREQAKQDQLRADQICAQTRLMAEDLLKDEGTIKRAIAARIIWGLLSVTGVGTVMILASEHYSRKQGSYHLWELRDQVGWGTRINSAEPPISVQIKSEGGVDPKGADFIDVRVEGLSRTLHLFKNYGVTYLGKEYSSNYTSSQRVDLEEAQRWHALISTLQQTN